MSRVTTTWRAANRARSCGCTTTCAVARGMCTAYGHDGRRTNSCRHTGTHASPNGLAGCGRPRFSRAARAPPGWRALPSRARLHMKAMRAPSASQRRASLGLRRPPTHPARPFGLARMHTRQCQFAHHPGGALRVAHATAMAMVSPWAWSRSGVSVAGTCRRVPKRGPAARRYDAVMYHWSTGAARGGPREVRRCARGSSLRLIHSPAAAHPTTFRRRSHPTATATVAAP